MVDKNYSARGLFKFVTGTMFAGKSKALILEYKKHKSSGENICVLTYRGSKSGANLVSSRAGNSIPADGYFAANMMSEIPKNTKIILIDEGQFLQKNQIYYLYKKAKNQGIKVIIYGLRTDFAGELFDGTRYILALADEMKILHHECPCGNTAIMHKQILKTNNDIFAEYKSLCLDCYEEKL
jgi:thymidine kinase